MGLFKSKSIDNPARTGQPDFQRADLVFYGVDHSGPSYEARVYLNNPDADLRTPRDAASHYAGSFTIFGHAGCAGDAGHCEVPTGPRDPFDRRPPHPLTPQTKTVIVTDALRLLDDDKLQITVVPVRPGREGAEVVDTLKFDRFSLLTYS
jgi:hypothetical protein